jgi:hypothetical protein
MTGRGGTVCRRSGYGRPNVSSIPSVPALGRAELALEAPVRAELDEARGLLAAEPTQDLLHRSFQVVVLLCPSRLRCRQETGRTAGRGDEKAGMGT